MIKRIFFLLGALALLAPRLAAAQTVSITSPAPNAQVSGTVSFCATSTSPVSWFDYFVGDGNGGGTEVGSGPGCYSWNTSSLSLGGYFLMAAGYNTGIDYPQPIAGAAEFVTVVSSGGGGGGSCQDIPGTTTPVGAGCAPMAPALNSPHDPINYGADDTGTNDSSAAISSAIDAGGDVYFGTAGTYLINLGGSGDHISQYGIWLPANTKVECAPGVTLKSNYTTSHQTGDFWFYYGGNGIYNCNLQGPNTGASPKNYMSSNGEGLILMSNGSGYTIQGNTFMDTAGNTAVAVEQSVGNVTMQFNTCASNPYYCFNSDGTLTTAMISNNLVTDGVMGIEHDSCPNGGTIGTGITFTKNEVNVVGGDCAEAGNGSCNPPQFNADAYALNGTCNYSGETMGPSNYVTGTSSITAHIEAGFGVTNSGSGNLVNITGNTLGPNATCYNTVSGQSCP